MTLREHQQYVHLKLSTTVDDGYGTVLTRYIIQPGCNCVILGTEALSAPDGDVVRYGSAGGIRQNGVYRGLVDQGRLTDLTAFEPFFTHGTEWAHWLAACNAAFETFHNAMGRTAPAGKAPPTLGDRVVGLEKWVKRLDGDVRAHFTSNRAHGVGHTEVERIDSLARAVQQLQRRLGSG